MVLFNFLLILIYLVLYFLFSVKFYLSIVRSHFNGLPFKQTSEQINWSDIRSLNIVYCIAVQVLHMDTNRTSVSKGIFFVFKLTKLPDMYRFLYCSTRFSQQHLLWLLRQVFFTSIAVNFRLCDYSLVTTASSQI